VPVSDALSCGPGTTLDGGLCLGSDGAGGSAPDAAQADASGPSDTTADTAVDIAPETIDAAETAADTPSCVPGCAGRQCGDDGCGGSCGACTDPGKPTCNTALGVCVATCIPACEGKNCGDDGCGGTCGACEEGLACKAVGRCAPEGWTCSAFYYGAADACDCGCGAADPDCMDPTNVIAGCASLEICDAKGTCTSKIPQAWTCAATTYDALDACDCGCGAPDPDCAFATLPLHGCTSGETCKADGTCAACTPACADKQCGDDGCGGSCGTCDDPVEKACDAGKCVDPCAPSPIACKTAECGNDGCGGSCGECTNGSACDSGACKAVPLPEAPTSCVGHCGSKAESGCACTASCEKNGSCCEDYKNICSCVPDCKGKACGSDGCGGSCGTCSDATPFCDATQQCTASCAKQCDGKACGDDGCGGSCGTCAATETCSWSMQCVPKAWFCPASYFNDGLACDCGCGAPDPDCADAKLLVFGCPTSNTACEPTGLCKVDLCGTNGECTGAWCTGTYAAGGGTYKGVCQAPSASAKAPGAYCKAGAECASGVCLEGLCRVYCQADGDCPSSQRCLGVEVTNPLDGALIGFAGVCETPAGSGAPCADQKSCAAPGELCRAFVDPVTFGPRYLCATGTEGGGASCASAPCPLGQICAGTPKGPTCGLACPGGAADCKTGTSCGSTSFHTHGTPDPADDPKVAVCVPN